MSSRYDPQPIIQAPPVTMFTAPNPSAMTLEGTHTYVVGHERSYVIDPGPDIPQYIDALAGWLQESGCHVASILLTHGHPDHAPGAARLKWLLNGVPIWAAPSMATDIAAEAGVDHRFTLEQAFDVDGHRLSVLSTPGHTGDHVAFWLTDARILFAGDTILGRGSSVIAPPDGDMADYMRTLGEIQILRPTIIAPGHGPIISNPAAKLAEYIEHRKEREQQILDALAEGPAGIDDLVGRIYLDTDPGLLDFARRSVEAQLLKLESENRVRRRSCEYWRT